MITEVFETREAAAALRGTEGDLIWIRISVDARHLEDILEAVAELPFPINPEIRHAAGSARVEFPAYSGRVGETRRALAVRGFDAACVEVLGIFER